MGEKFRFSSVARLGSKRVTVWSGSNDDKFKVVLPRVLLESFLDKNGMGFDSISSVAWDKESFVLVNRRWFHKSLVSGSGKSLKSKFYRKEKVRLSRAEVYWFSKLIYQSLVKFWVSGERNQANVTLETLGGFRSEFRDSGDVLWIRVVKVILKHICVKGIWSRRMSGDGIWSRRCEEYLETVVMYWFKETYRQISRWKPKKPLGDEAVSDGEKYSWFVDRLRTMAYYSVDSKWLYKG